MMSLSYDIMNDVTKFGYTLDSHQDVFTCTHYMIVTCSNCGNVLIIKLLCAEGKQFTKCDHTRVTTLGLP